MKDAVGQQKIVRSFTLIECLKELKMFEVAKNVLSTLHADGPLKIRIILQHFNIRLKLKQE